MNSFITITLLALAGVALAAPPKYGHAGHGHGGLVMPGPAVVHTYPAVAPAVKCGHNLVVSCGTHHAAVPCKAESHGHAYGHGGHAGHGGHGGHAGHSGYRAHQPVEKVGMMQTGNSAEII